MKKPLGILLLMMISGCGGEQSVFSGVGPVSARITVLMWVMFTGAVLIAALIAFLTFTAINGPFSWQRKLAGENPIVWGGIVFPFVVLSALLVYGLLILKSGETLISSGEPPVRISVIGEQWWWRILYRHEDGQVTESANELRIPAGRLIELELSTADVIHSFWIPAYAGKVDMIPGRTNTLHFIAGKLGIVRGQCAEYCGGAHALMSLYAVAMQPAEYEAWLAKERAGKQPAQSEGEHLFLASGCGGCHTVRGIQAEGKTGPDLTHVGSRLSLGAGILHKAKVSFVDWISRHQKIKPDNLMPPYGFFSEQELQSLADYLHSLE